MERRSAALDQRWRWRIVAVGFIIFGVLIAARLWQLQIARYETYASEATDQRTFTEETAAKRGEIYATEISADGKEHRIPLAVNRDAYIVYVDTRRIEDKKNTAEAISDIIDLPYEEVLAAVSKSNDPYEPLKRRVDRDTADKIKSLKLSGVGLEKMSERFYPNNNISSSILGFVGYAGDVLSGQYGLEGHFDSLLAGRSGSVRSERDAKGVWIPFANQESSPVEDGANLVLTIDWTIQFKACQALNAWVNRHGADGGSVIVLNPKTGAVIAMCGSPDFNPNIYNETTGLAAFNNPGTFLAYEPGSIFKSITMAAALDKGAVTPDTVYTDEGFVKIGPNTIRNSDGKANGVQNMTEVLDNSLNTGAIFAMRQIGQKIFRQYVEDFGFGTITGIELDQESAGNVKSLYENNEIYAATGSFGQGISATPLQMVAAYATIANGGALMKPYLVREIERSSGKVEKTEPTKIRQVISERTARLLSGMLVSVVENGHGKKAGVEGYYIAGKTGTAQIPKKDGPGYESGANIGSFVGFGPVEDPRFAMIVRIDRPRDVQFAESSAAPLFGEIAKFILQYYEIPTNKQPK